MVPNIIIYLDAGVDVCKERIGTRGRDCEQNIPTSYLSSLRDGYEELLIDFEEMGSKVYRINWNKFKDVDYVLEILFKDRRFQTFWQGYQMESGSDFSRTVVDIQSGRVG